MTNQLKHNFHIARSIAGESCRSLAEKWGVSKSAVTGVANGNSKSEAIEKKIRDFTKTTLQGAGIKSGSVKVTIKQPEQTELTL